MLLTINVSNNIFPMIKKQIIFYFSLLAVVMVSCKKVSTSRSSITFDKLLVNAKENPIAIENNQFDFSWTVSVDGYNKSQSAYHILVASSIEKLNEGDADLWNSKKVESNKSTFVKYKGKALEAMLTYFWKVKIWDEKGTASKWSTVQQFQMGLMDSKNWGASKWITLNKDTRTSTYQFRDYKTGRMKNQPAKKVNGFPASYFRNELIIDKKIENAQAYICGLGYYELYLNGAKVGDHVLDPAPSNYDKQAYYVKYDITKEVAKGKNAFGIILGNGFYGQNISWSRDPESNKKGVSYGPPTVKMLVKVNYKDGTSTDFYTDENWKEATGPIVFNNIYGGDTYDANYELGNWNSVGYKDTNWGNAKVASPKLRTVSAQQIPVIKKLKVLEPQKVFKGADGNWIVDFGQNIAG